MTLDGLKALSVRQPWAWALIHAGKNVENRGPVAIRHMKLRKGDRIAIHAARGMTQWEYDYAVAFMRQINVIDCPHARDLVRGAIIGSVRVEDVVTRSFSKWFMGPRGIIVSDPHPCEPIPAVGALGLFTWTPGGELAAPAIWMLPNQQPKALVEEVATLFPAVKAAR